jgi:hypothetical protein
MSSIIEIQSERLPQGTDSSNNQTPLVTLSDERGRASLLSEDNQTSTDVRNKPLHRVIQNEDGKFEARSIEEIYDTQYVSLEFRNASRLLKEAQDYINQSIEYFQQGDMFASDDAINHLHALLPELFCCRNLSESFGTIINSILHALRNRKGLALNENQLFALRRILESVRDAPFMRYDKAIDLIMDFEDAGFVVEPQGFDE